MIHTRSYTLLHIRSELELAPLAMNDLMRYLFMVTLFLEIYDARDYVVR